MIKIEAATRCSCGRAVTVALDSAGVWVSLCYDCYDPTEDASDRAHAVGIGKTPDESLWAWQDAHDEAHEVTWELTDLVGELALQVSEETERQQGWALIGPDPDHVAAWYPRYWLPPPLATQYHGHRFTP